MKRILFLFVLALMAVNMAQAVPARFKPTRVKQPDGKYITVRLVGDEYYHYSMTTDGYALVSANDGSLVYAMLNSEGRLKPTTMLAHDEELRTPAERKLLESMTKYQAPVPTEVSKQLREQEEQRRMESRIQRKLGLGYTYDYHDFRGLVLLVEYGDCSFSRSDYPKIINNMVNQKDYKGFFSLTYGWDAFTGSMRDYFYDNSFHQFDPQFDIVGPVKIDESQFLTEHNASEWDQFQAYARVVAKALDAAEDLVNFKDYDRDNNGVVDMVYLIFAGAGSHTEGNDDRLLWPHTGDVYSTTGWGYKLSKDGVWFGRYACGTELLGPPSYKYLDGIGTMCHEFSHVLGLPDFYDTDYSKSGGESQHIGEWSLMAGGSHLNNGRTPVAYSLYERWNAGFTVPEPISEPGTYSLECIDSVNSGFRLSSGSSKEYFLIENRQPGLSKWDAYLPGHGMLVYRVDESNTQVWLDNQINVDPTHNYYQLLRAGNGRATAQASDPFPGTAKKTSLTNITQPSLISWNKKYEAPLVIENIAEKNGVITFDLVKPVYDRTNWEDFENMPLTNASATDTVRVEGHMGLWTLTDGACIASASGKAAEQKALAMVKNSNAYVSTKKPVMSLTFTLYNPNSASAMPYFYVSEDNTTWKQLRVVNSEAGRGVTAGSSMQMTITPNHSLPSNLRFWLRIGDSTSPVYLDNFQFTFDESYDPSSADIQGVLQTPTAKSLRYYNLHGQPVGPNTRGLIIVSDGKKRWKERR